MQEQGCIDRRSIIALCSSRFTIPPQEQGCTLLLIVYNLNKKANAFCQSIKKI